MNDITRLAMAVESLTEAITALSVALEGMKAVPPQPKRNPPCRICGVLGGHSLGCAEIQAQAQKWAWGRPQ